MGIYTSIRDIINEMVYDIVTEENLMKYIVYDNVSSDPLNESAVTNPEQYIFNPKSYSTNPEFNKNFRIYPTPVPNITEDKKTIVCVGLVRTEAIDSNPFFRKGRIYFDIVTHLDLNAIYGGKLRLFEIMDRINELYNQKYTEKSMQKVFPLDDIPIRYNDKIWGYRLVYHITNISSTAAVGG